MKKIYLMTALALVMNCANANAAGYQLNEYSVTNLGRSFAGVGIMGDDYSAIAYNPAGMTLMKQSGLQTGVTVTEVASKIKGRGANQGKKTDMDFGIALPQAFGQWNVNDKLFLGAGVYVPYGLETRYKHDSFIAQTQGTQGASGVRESSLEVVDTNLSAAYKVDSQWSFGVSAILRHIKGELTTSIGGNENLYSDFKVSGWSTTGTLGTVYEYDDNTRFGLSYRMKSTQKTKGHHDITNNLGFPYMYTDSGFNRFYSISDPELPASWTFSAFHKFAEKWGTSFSAKFTEWHRFPTFPGYSTWAYNNGNLDVDYKWEDAWTFSLGEDYYMNENWTLRAGTAWDESPVPGNDYRTNRIPDADRIWLSLGASYTKGNHQFDLGFAHLFMMGGNVTRRDDTAASYRSYSNMYALQYQYKF